jgi:NAD(P)-dependent dehydrogenase (short-subunit alcohol dehydrogenase family)
MFVAAWRGLLHLLVNNAGVMAIQEHQKTSEGWEMQFATNHLGHFSLSLGLHDALASAGAARIVAVSSSAHMLSPVVFDDIHFAFRRYDPWAAYGQSKTANVLFAVGVTARWAADGITANALSPGAIATNLQRHIGRRLTTPPIVKKLRSKELLPPSCLRPRRCSKASAAVILRTATKPSLLHTASTITTALPRTHSTLKMPTVSGKNLCT